MSDHDKATEPAVEVEPKPFATFLIEHARGKTHDELSRAMRDLLVAIDQTGKSGSITLKVTVVPGGAPGAVVVTDEVKSSLPRGERPKSIFFVDEHMRLQRNDPRQMSLDSIANGDN